MAKTGHQIDFHGPQGRSGGLPAQRQRAGSAFALFVNDARFRVSSIHDVPEVFEDQAVINRSDPKLEPLTQPRASRLSWAFSMGHRQRTLRRTEGVAAPWMRVRNRPWWRPCRWRSPFIWMILCGVSHPPCERPNTFPVAVANNQLEQHPGTPGRQVPGFHRPERARMHLDGHRPPWRSIACSSLRPTDESSCWEKTAEATQVIDPHWRGLLP